MRERLGAEGRLRVYDRTGTSLDGTATLQRSAVGAIASYYALADELAEEAARLLEEADPNVFTAWLTGADLRPAFCFTTAMALATNVLPGLAAFLAAERGDRRAVVVNAGLTEQAIARVAGALNLPGGPVESLAPTGATRPSARTLEATSATGVAEKELAGLPLAPVLLLCGAQSEVQRLAGVARAAGGPAVPVVALGRADSPEGHRALERLAPCVTVTAHSLISRLRPVGAALAGARAAAARLDAGVSRLPSELSIAAAPHAIALARLARLAGAWARVIERVDPVLVAGTVERSALGPIASAHAPRRYRLVEVQHGLFPPNVPLAQLPLDGVLAWNERSRDAVVARSLGGGPPVAVVGDPAWDRLSRLDDEMTGTVAKELLAWKAGSILLVVFPQPLRGPLLSSRSQRALFSWICDAALADERVKVLVKRRASGEHSPHEYELEPLIAAGRARVVAAEEVSIEEALRAADAGVSIASSALLETLAAGRTAIAVDPDGIAPLLGLEQAVVVCRGAHELRRAIEAVGRAEPPPGVAAAIPTFAEHYPARVARALQAAGTWPPSPR